MIIRYLLLVFKMSYMSGFWHACCHNWTEFIIISDFIFNCHSSIDFKTRRFKTFRNISWFETLVTFNFRWKMGDLEYLGGKVIFSERKVQRRWFVDIS